MEKVNIELLQYQIKLLNTMISSMDNFNLHFFNFIIDNNISEAQTKSIMQGLILIKDRVIHGNISDELRNLYGDSEVFKILDKETPATFSDFNKLVNTIVDEDINAEYLLKSLIMQGINKEICQELLNSRE